MICAVSSKNMIRNELERSPTYIDCSRPLTGYARGLCKEFVQVTHEAIVEIGISAQSELGSSLRIEENSLGIFMKGVIKTITGGNQRSKTEVDKIIPFRGIKVQDTLNDVCMNRNGPK
jgi:hypothetical protein